MTSYGGFIDWWNDLSLGRIGSLWQSKLNYDFINGNLPTTVESTIMAAIEANLRALESLSSAASGIDLILKSDPGSFEMQGQRTPTDVEGYSCVIRLEVLAHYYLRRRSLLTVLDEADDELDYIWDNLDTIITSRFLTGTLRTEKAFFWCTPTYELQTIERHGTPDASATAIRTRLGLHLVAQGHRLVRIEIPPEALRGMKVVAPTTLDAGYNPVFIPSNEADGHGRTLNLESYVRDLKELISEPLDLADSFTPHRIGTVQKDISVIDFDAIERLVNSGA